MFNHEKKTMMFTKQDFAILVLGIGTYIADIGIDVWVITNYFNKGLYLWCSLTLAVVLLSSFVTQFFSYAWFKEDNNEKLNWVWLLHLFHGGIFTRYWFTLKDGYQAAFKQISSENQLIDDFSSITHETAIHKIHKTAIDGMADISMLRLFKTFLESTPQLILQIYILMSTSNSSISQYTSIVVSFISVTCSTVDYQIALRKSLPDKNKFARLTSKITYLLYKLLTLISWILCIALVMVLSTTIACVLVVLFWLGGFCWTMNQHTEFCKSAAAENIYRIMVGIILIFTFFNIKGEKTRVPLSVYYIIRALTTLAIVCTCIFWKINLFVITTVAVTLVSGICFLLVYYRFFHPNNQCAQDEVDGPEPERGKMCRISKFIM
ncbi:XK-related protein 9 [Sphaerodactylus townsendi]|uniref:XK-related protein 9 n=1 Tax=Sphaerodactylus townsendi TaxID=933632 RepID=UPI0020268A2B|nr:XK-related protein 9 [Sphaerodactylus townsendi]